MSSHSRSSSNRSRTVIVGLSFCLVFIDRLELHQGVLDQTSGVAVVVEGSGGARLPGVPVLKDVQVADVAVRLIGSTCIEMQMSDSCAIE